MAAVGDEAAAAMRREMECEARTRHHDVVDVYVVSLSLSIDP